MPPIATVTGVLQHGTHSSRPAATDVGVGALYACSTHGKVYVSDAATWSDWFSLTGATYSMTVPYVIDGGGAVITTGVKGDLEVGFAATITAVRMLADQSGSVVVDVWKDTYANFPATVADSITASAKPTISAATKSQDTTLTGWTTSISAGDVLRFNVDSCSSITRVTLSLTVTRTI